MTHEHAGHDTTPADSPADTPDSSAGGGAMRDLVDELADLTGSMFSLLLAGTDAAGPVTALAAVPAEAEPSYTDATPAESVPIEFEAPFESIPVESIPVEFDTSYEAAVDTPVDLPVAVALDPAYAAEIEAIPVVAELPTEIPVPAMDVPEALPVPALPVETARPAGPRTTALLDEIAFLDD